MLLAGLKNWKWGTKEPHCPRLFPNNTAEENTLCYSGQVQFCYLWCIPGEETFIIAAVLARPGWATAAGWSQADQQFHFFSFPCFLPEARKPKTSAHLVPWGNIGIFNNILRKNQFLHPSFGRAPTLSKILHYTPQPPPSCAYRNPHTNASVCHTHLDMRAHKHALSHTHILYSMHVHTQPRAPIFLWASLLWPQSPFHISEDVYMQCVRMCVCVSVCVCVFHSIPNRIYVCIFI